MLWGLPKILDQNWVSAVQTAKNILGFNEPDLTYEQSSNMLPEAAAAGYKSYIEQFKGQVRIGGPGVLWNNWNSVRFSFILPNPFKFSHHFTLSLPLMISH